MDPARIAELLAPFLVKQSASPSSDLCHSEERSKEESAFLSTVQLQRISTYIDILLRWNARINLTAIRNPEDIVTRHFGESLFAALHLFPGGRAALQGRVTGQEEAGALAPLSEGRVPRATDPISLADIGSGAGFPGLPIKLWAPQISLTLVESNHKKATFLREVVRALTLTGINIQTTRVERLLQPNPDLARQDDLAKLDQERKAGQDFQPPFDVVSLRAVERFPAILPQAASLVTPGGRLALLIGAAQQAHVLATLPMFRWPTQTPIPMSRSRTLLIGTREPTK